MKRVLIANRGEIALRVIRACKDHGLESVAMYSEEDRDALHAKSADFAYSLEGTVAKDTYLNIPKIIALAKRAGADAVHPGYGFLSENADFAERVERSGFKFIGPTADVIRIMGDKVAAKKSMIAAGVPCVPGSSRKWYMISLITTSELMSILFGAPKVAMSGTNILPPCSAE